jgi:hypothetical protein
MNWYPEAVESGAGKGPVVLYPTPGLSVFCTLNNSPIQQIINANGRCFVVAGSVGSAYLYELFITGTFTRYSPGFAGPGPYTFAVGQTQLMICSGQNLYCFNLQSNTFQTITGLAQNFQQSVGYSDGFFVTYFFGTNQFQVSNAGDGSTWQALNVSNISVFPENIAGMLVDHREVWFWGAQHAQVYFDNGAAGVPFSPIPSAFMETGLGAQATTVQLDNSVFWFHSSSRGNGVVWRANGYAPLRISNHAVEQAWRQYVSTADAVAFGYEDAGHSFYVITFPNGGSTETTSGQPITSYTWVYDCATQLWHERGYWNPNSATWGPVLGRTHSYSLGRHLVGDYLSSNVYAMSVYTGTDNGAYIRRMRRAPHVSNEQAWILHRSIQIDLEVGLGTQTGQGSTPQVMLRWSDDGAKTWSNEHAYPAGAVGQTLWRTIARRLGRSRDRVYEMCVSDPIPWNVVDAYLQADPAYTKPTERLATSLRKIA